MSRLKNMLNGSCLFVLLGVLILPRVATLADESWTTVSVPDAWRKVPTGELEPVDGFSWYRVRVFVPKTWSGHSLTLHVESMDDARASYFNGVRVGATGTFPPQFRSGLGENGRFEISASSVKAGQWNSIAIRLYQYDPRPNFSVSPPVLLNQEMMQGIRLGGMWEYRPGDDSAYATTLPDARPDAESTDYAVIDSVTDIDTYISQRDGDTPPLSPSDAEAGFDVPDDLQFQLVLSEPQVAQPLFMTWDERGRLWVVEYRQYPDIAGVKMLSRDVYLRSVYDRVPEPPPHGARGRDRISIHEDTDGDGVYDQHKIFVDGLNLASSVAIGRGGAFVTNPPYLLFYPDRDGNDVPDGDPEVLLEGFGLEDSHSVINSLRFGPDGWLYGCQGSTVSAAVRIPGSKAEPVRSMGQLIWRYHPETKRYEVFAEGGGNTFGCEIDSKGRIYSGHNGGNTRGFHYVQGGYYRKGFGKHGPLSNPYAFGYFDHIKSHDVARFTHNFVIYEDEVLPATYHGRLLGIEPLQGQVVLSDVRPYQSSFETEDLSRVVKTNDPWFRPVDIKTGPDGCVYVADMYEQRIDHSSHYAGRIDRSNGRIYKLKPARETAMPTVQSEHVLQSLQQPIRWHRQTANRQIGDNPDAVDAAILLQLTMDSADQLALESLWALHLAGGLTDSAATQLLQHPDQFVRAWTVRLLCDDHQVSAPLAQSLAEMASQEAYVHVRKQLASSARRLPAVAALPIIANLLRWDEDEDDIHQPLLLWWAIEAHVTDADRSEVLDEFLTKSDSWQHPLFRQHLAGRLMKRFALSGSREELIAAAQLFQTAPDKQAQTILMDAFEEAFAGRSLADIPNELVAAITKAGGGSMALRLRQGDTAAIEQATLAVLDPNVPTTNRKEYLNVFGQLRRQEFLPALRQLIEGETNPELLTTALTAAAAYDHDEVGDVVVTRWLYYPAEVRDAAETLIASRVPWSQALLTAVAQERIPAAQVSETCLRKMLLHRDDEISTRIRQQWGTIAGASTEQMRNEMMRVASILAAGSGNPKRGKPLFMQQCGKCHRLFGEGGQIGPDLTAFKRDNQDRILTNIINPSLEVREGFESYVAVTIDGRVVTGFMADKDSQVLILRGVDAQNIVLQHDEIDEISASKISLMPEGTLKMFNDQQVRDLFAYLRSSQPVNY